MEASAVSAIPTPAGGDGDDACASPPCASSPSPSGRLSTDAGRAESDLLAFFPATRPEFVCRAGAVAAVRREDFENEHRARHLLSFQRSMQEWGEFDPDSRNSVEPAVIAEFTRRLLEKNPKTTAEFNQCCAELRKFFRRAPSKAQIIAAYEALTRAEEGVQAESAPKVSDASETGTPSGCETLSASPEKNASWSDAKAPRVAGGTPVVSDASASVSSESRDSSAVSSAAPVKRNRVLETLMRRKAIRTNSGVLVITVLTSPGKFSCPHNCHYCPNEPGQPRSYLSTEPAVLRANQNDWDAVRQFHDRASTLQGNGHTVDKIEVLVLGGTWSGYPSDYQEEFIRDLFYAANVFNSPLPFRPKLPLEEEQTANETAECRIIGLTLETRPDFINRFEIRKLRRFGCTRVQLGLQHVENEVLQYINRGCERHDAVKAIRLLKDSGYKVDIHIMPDLPSSTAERDLRMFFYLLGSSDLQADQWKLYPCEVTPFSEIERWYSEGSFVPYAEKDGGRELVDLLLRVKAAVHPWIRLNRVVRDIPNQSIIAGNNITNLRQLLTLELEKRGLTCKCIRCREVKDMPIDVHEKAVLKVREYPSNGGQELFLSFETEDEAIIFGFLRLRLRWEDQPRNKKDVPFACLDGAALLRELHVYGSLVAHGEDKIKDDCRPQHAGLGRRLMQAAEILAMSRGFFRMAVIAGVGTREYYRKNGYELRETYMVKDLAPPPEGDFSLLGMPLPPTITVLQVPLLSASELLVVPLPEPEERQRPKDAGRQAKDANRRRESPAAGAASAERGDAKQGKKTRTERGNHGTAQDGEQERRNRCGAGEAAAACVRDLVKTLRDGCQKTRSEVVDVEKAVQDIRKAARRETQENAVAAGPRSTTYVDPDTFGEFATVLYPQARLRVERHLNLEMEQKRSISQIRKALANSLHAVSEWWAGTCELWKPSSLAMALGLGLVGLGTAAGVTLIVSRAVRRRV
ncbi:putative elongator complex protein 3 [Neospora caninum Liverpool]|uniref:tRNA carboxymethyluridine synthase n=1 Tax=Neospora caninum (strain Liverpool) TaxID=572307 RepID=F0VAS4_NEOCL|nr:putative elongator complex protein 3 [Neospora caninum Liverpool]CBZ51332.1 putative elongator complex protein 3 [Neospora caninum Liverpool]CEL68649.1 TPA: elongator complex protein 3, putative [Neospora caninum Liverpool]|eukprot:XP_003881365.1 putative elongator complex protein 3 [Neospora caninum Liverpool]